LLRVSGLAAAGLTAGCALDNPDVQGGVLFLENRSDEVRRAHLRVTSGTDEGGERVVDERYRLPAYYALEFGDVLHSGEKYRIRVRQEAASDPEETMEMPVETCDEETPSDQMYVSAILSRNGPGISRWGCKDEYTERERLTYVDEASEYAIGTDATSS
jgi:hypothetical protein